MRGYGKKIKEYRNKRNLSQEELGEKLNVSKSYISKIENEKTPMSLETLGKIALILSVSPSDLIDNEQQEPPEELKNVGAEWLITIRKLKDQGFTPEQVEEWAKIVKYYDNK